jgi:signal transduction histidine kinase
VRVGAQLELDAVRQIVGLSPEAEQCIYRITDEALNNIARHAKAKTIRVHLSQDRDKTHLRVADDGQGFEAEAANANGHYGLRGMRERAQLIGATLNVMSEPDQGTEIELIVSNIR